MSSLLEVHGWKLVTLASATMLSCSLALSAWLLVPKKQKPTARPMTDAETAQWILDQRTRTWLQTGARNEDLKEIAAGADPKTVQAGRDSQSTNWWKSKRGSADPD